MSATVTTQVTTQTETTVPPRVHLNYLDGLRALAALYVVMNHIMVTIWPGPAQFHGMLLLLAGPFRCGHYAVGLFIVLSGFSLMLPIARNGGQMRDTIGRFYYKRSHRILPPYYASLLLSLLACYTVIGHKTGTHWDACLPVTRAGIVSHLLMLQDIFSGLQINHTLWSISVEWRIYFLFPLLVFWFRRSGGISVAAAMWALSTIGFCLLYHTKLVQIMPAYYWLFTLGMLACEICYGRLTRLQTRVPWRLIMAPLAIIFTLLLFKWRTDISEQRIFILDCLTGILSAGLLILASKPGVLQRMLSVRPLVFAGTFAYSLYLIHAPLIQLIWQYAVHPFGLSMVASYMLLLVAGLPLILIGSYGFFLAFERPFLNTRSSRPASTAPYLPQQKV